MHFFLFSHLTGLKQNSRISGVERQTWYTQRQDRHEARVDKVIFDLRSALVYRVFHGLLTSSQFLFIL